MAKTPSLDDVLASVPLRQMSLRERLTKEHQAELDNLVERYRSGELKNRSKRGLHKVMCERWGVTVSVDTFAKALEREDG